MAVKKIIGELIRKSETDYIRGNTTISKYIIFSQHETLERIDAYLNSKHISGDEDSQGREKPFFNITTAAVNIWYRATDLDRKDIKFVPKDNKSVILAFVANIILQKWMEEERFGVFLNDWGRSLARYGSSVLKFVTNKTGLHTSVIPWNRLITDTVDFENNPKIEIIELTEAQLRQRVRTNNYDKEQVDSLTGALRARETIDKYKKDTKNDYIKLYELHGLLPIAYLKQAKGKEPTDADWDEYVQQMHVISFLVSKNGRSTEYADYTLFSGEEAQDPYMITHLIKEEGRALAIGAPEHLFESQWMTNHANKTIKDTLDISSRLIFQTADTHFVGRNVLSQIESGDILIHNDNQPLNKVDTSKADIVSMQNYAVSWNQLSQEITATPDALRGTQPPANTPYSTTALLAQQSNSLFEIMTENKGLAVEDMMTQFIIPQIKKTLKHSKEIMAILDQAGLQQIDMMYIPDEAAKRYNAQTINAVLSGAVPSPYQAVLAQQQLQQQVASQGNARSFIPDHASDKTWADVFSDFEWDSIRVEVTNEQIDKQQILQVLNTVMQTIASNPMILNNPNAMQLFSAIMRETGAISPAQLSSSGVLPPLPPTTVQIRDTINYKDLPPDAQQQLLSRMGIQTQPPPSGSNGALPVKQ